MKNGTKPERVLLELNCCATLSPVFEIDDPEKDEYGDPVDYETIVWDSDSWQELEKPIPIKSSI